MILTITLANYFIFVANFILRPGSIQFQPSVYLVPSLCLSSSNLRRFSSSPSLCSSSPRKNPHISSKFISVSVVPSFSIQLQLCAQHYLLFRDTRPLSYSILQIVRALGSTWFQPKKTRTCLPSSSPPKVFYPALLKRDKFLFYARPCNIYLVRYEYGFTQKRQLLATSSRPLLKRLFQSIGHLTALHKFLQIADRHNCMVFNIGWTISVIVNTCQN